MWQYHLKLIDMSDTEFDVSSIASSDGVIELPVDEEGAGQDSTGNEGANLDPAADKENVDENKSEDGSEDEGNDDDDEEKEKEEEKEEEEVKEEQPEKKDELALPLVATTAKPPIEKGSPSPTVDDRSKSSIAVTVRIAGTEKDEKNASKRKTSIRDTDLDDVSTAVQQMISEEEEDEEEERLPTRQSTGTRLHPAFGLSPDPGRSVSFHSDVDGQSPVRHSRKAQVDIVISPVADKIGKSKKGSIRKERGRQGRHGSGSSRSPSSRSSSRSSSRGRPGSSQKKTSKKKKKAKDRRSSTSPSSGEEQDGQSDGERKKKSSKKKSKKKKKKSSKSKKKSKRKRSSSKKDDLASDEEEKSITKAGASSGSKKKHKSTKKLDIVIDGVQLFSDVEVSDDPENYAPPRDLSPRSAAEYVKAKLKEAAKRRAKKRAGKKKGKKKGKRKRRKKKKRRKKHGSDSEDDSGPDESEIRKARKLPPGDQHFFPTPRNLFKKRCVFSSEAKPVVCSICDGIHFRTKRNFAANLRIIVNVNKALTDILGQMRNRMTKIDNNLVRVKQNLEYLEDMYEGVFRKVNRLIA